MFLSVLTPAQGNGYLVLRQVEEWLDTIHINVSTHGEKVASILSEAQQFLNH